MATDIQRRLARFEEVANAIRYGLRGHPFSWPEWARKLNVPIAAQMGCTLLTLAQIQRRGLQLKRGARPVGSAYWGAPIQRQAGLYLVEAQTVFVLRKSL